MTRDEQIKNTACYYSIKASEDTWNRPDWEDIEWAFEVGAKWADANPNWHTEPPTIEENKFCSSYKLIYLNDGSFEMAYYNRRGEWVISAFDTLDKTMEQEVIAWTELPEPPKFD